MYRVTIQSIIVCQRRILSDDILSRLHSAFTSVANLKLSRALLFFPIIACAACAEFTKPIVSRNDNGDNDNGDTVAVYYLPKARVPITLYRNYPETATAAGYPVFAVEIGSSKVYPDTSQSYFLEYRESPFSDDRLCVARTQDGLLKAVHLDASDRTGDIVVRLAETAALVLSAVGGGGPSLVVASDEKPNVRSAIEKVIGIAKHEKAVIAYTLMFDPTSEKEREEAINNIKAWIWPALKKEFEQIKQDPSLVDFAFSIEPKKVVNNSDGETPPKDKTTCEDCVFYRTKQSGVLSLNAAYPGTLVPVLSRSVDYVDDTETKSIKIARSRFIERVTKLS